jgi:hypothetical protein
MVWFKVDDTLPFNAKVTAAGNAAMGLWVRAGAWSCQQLSGGFVPTHIARSLGTQVEAKRLCDAHLWEAVDGGYQFWQWHEEGRQPTKARVEADRHAARERQRRARERAESQRESRDASRRDSEDASRRDIGVSHGGVTGVVTVPPTRPDPSLSTSVSSSLPPSRNASRENGKAEENPPHKHEANTIRALTALKMDRSLPLTVNELLVHAYRLGHGDPWQGYLAVKVATNFQLESARNPVLALRARLEAAT